MLVVVGAGAAAVRRGQGAHGPNLAAVYPPTRLTKRSSQHHRHGSNRRRAPSVVVLHYTLTPSSSRPPAPWSASAMGGFYGVTVSMAQQRRARQLPAVLPPLACNGRNVVINTSVLGREPTGRWHGVCRRRTWLKSCGFPKLKSVCSRHFGLAVRLATPSLLDFDSVRVYCFNCRISMRP